MYSLKLKSVVLYLKILNVSETNCIIHWIEIYPVDSAIQLLNNWGQKYKTCKITTMGKKQFLARVIGIQKEKCG